MMPLQVASIIEPPRILSVGRWAAIELHQNGKTRADQSPQSWAEYSSPAHTVAAEESIDDHLESDHLKLCEEYDCCFRACDAQATMACTSWDKMISAKAAMTETL